MNERNDTSELSAEQQYTATVLERLLGRAISDRYVDFCRLAAGVFELRVSRPVAAHTLRELEGILRKSLMASLKISPAEELIDPLYSKAREELSKLGLDNAAIERAVEALKPRTSQANQIRQITKTLGLAPDGDIAKAWISLDKTAGRAHERSFHQPLLVDEDFRENFQQPFEMLIRAITVALQRHYSVLMRRVACDTDVDRAAEVLEALLTNPNIDQWVYVGQDQSIRAILTAGRARGTPVTIKRVEEIVSFLASIGQPGYLDLVRASQSATANQYE